MVFEHNFEIGLKNIEKHNYVKNEAILEMLENTGGYHSDLVGYGVNDVFKTKLVWIILGWKLHVIKRPKYGQTMNIKTWGRDSTKISTYRDFEVYDNNNNLCAVATSKWTLINLDGKLTKLTENILDSYKLEDKCVFENRELDKIKIPPNYTNVVEYTVNRRDIDINNHMHNLYYLDVAHEALPQDVYDNRPYDNVIIQYKKEIKQGEIIKCKYALEDNKHIVGIYDADNILHALVELW